MVDNLILAWFALTLLGAAWVAWDLYTRTPAMSVMKPGWVLVSLYTGPVGVAIYLLTCRPPKPGLEAHDRYIKPLWRQAAGSAVHCVAGDATGVIFASSIAAYFGVASAIDVSLEYSFGFLFGLFIFQALFMRSMMGGYWAAVRKTILSEWLSMNMVMAGMIPVMVILMKHVPEADHPGTLRYWAIMQLAAIVGYAVGYPINYWLVGHGVKHGMMTQRPKGEPMHEGHEMSHDHHGASHAAVATSGQLAVATAVSLAFLAAGAALAWAFAGLSFTSR